MKIAVDDNFITGRLQISQPGNELSIFSGQTLMAIIGHNEKRTGGHAVMSEFYYHLFRDVSAVGGNIVHGDNDRIRRGSRRCDQRQEWIGNHRSHVRKFSIALVM